MDIKDLIKSKRIEKNLTMKELADKVGVSEATISRWESGEISNMKRKGIIKLANTLDISPITIMGWEDDTPILKKVVPISTQVKNLPYIPASVSAGTPLTVDAINEFDTISIPIEVLGRYANRKNLVAMKVNGDSMNKIIPDNSYVIIEREVQYKNGDIVVFSNNCEYGLKYYYDDKENKRIILRPSSSNKSYVDIIYKYENLSDFFIVGKVVVYTVIL